MACTDTSIISESTTDQSEYSVEAVLDPLICDNIGSTRVVPTDTGDGHYSFSWQANDKIAIYGQTSNSSGWGFFQLSGDGGDAAGVFSGIFKMTNETTYYSFYPPRNFTSETSPSTITLDYTGQTQIADGDMTHLKNYIYYAAAQAEDGRFKFKHVGALLKITLPDDHGDDCTSVTLSASGDGKFITKGKLDLTNTTISQPPSVTPVETSSTFTIGYTHGSSANTGNITVYAMIGPTDLSNCHITVTAFHQNSTYNKNYSVSPQTFLAGKPYTLIGTELIENVNMHNEHEFVDLGVVVDDLKILWAKTNIGAEKPADYGDYYAWGEVETKSSYSTSTYKYYQYFEEVPGTEDPITGIITGGKPAGYRYVDIGTDISGTEYDVAHVKWQGNWRMPNLKEQNALRSQCDWSWVQMKNSNNEVVNGYKVSKKGDSNTFIFLPAAGYRDNSYLNDTGSCGYYWSSSLYASLAGNACRLYFTPSSQTADIHNRILGQPVRAVCVLPE